MARRDVTGVNGFEMAKPFFVDVSIPSMPWASLNIQRTVVGL